VEPPCPGSHSEGRSGFMIRDSILGTIGIIFEGIAEGGDPEP
jgi:hypothetical protein